MEPYHKIKRIFLGKRNNTESKALAMHAPGPEHSKEFSLSTQPGVSSKSHLGVAQ